MYMFLKYAWDFLDRGQRSNANMPSGHLSSIFYDKMESSLMEKVIENLLEKKLTKRIGFQYQIPQRTSTSFD